MIYLATNSNVEVWKRVGKYGDKVNLETMPGDDNLILHRKTWSCRNDCQRHSVQSFPVFRSEGSRLVKAAVTFPYSFT